MHALWRVSAFFAPRPRWAAQPGRCCFRSRERFSLAEFVLTVSSPDPAAVPVPLGAAVRSRGDSCRSAVDSIPPSSAAEHPARLALSRLAPGFLCAVRFAETQLQRVAGAVFLHVVVGVDVEQSSFLSVQTKVPKAASTSNSVRTIKIELCRPSR